MSPTHSRGLYFEEDFRRELALHRNVIHVVITCVIHIYLYNALYTMYNALYMCQVYNNSIFSPVNKNHLQ